MRPAGVAPDLKWFTRALRRQHGQQLRQRYLASMLSNQLRHTVPVVAVAPMAGDFKNTEARREQDQAR